MPTSTACRCPETCRRRARRGGWASRLLAARTCAFALSISSSSNRIAGTLNARAHPRERAQLELAPPSRRESERRPAPRAAKLEDGGGRARVRGQRVREEAGEDGRPCRAAGVPSWRETRGPASPHSACRAPAPRGRRRRRISGRARARAARSSSPVRSTDAAPAAGCRASRSCICWWWFSRRSWRRSSDATDAIDRVASDERELRPPQLVVRMVELPPQVAPRVG